MYCSAFSSGSILTMNCVVGFRCSVCNQQSIPRVERDTVIRMVTCLYSLESFLLCVPGSTATSWSAFCTCIRAFQILKRTSANGTATTQYIQKLGKSLGPWSAAGEKVEHRHVKHGLSCQEAFQFPYVNETAIFVLKHTAMSISGSKLIPSTASAVMEELSLFAAFQSEGWRGCLSEPLQRISARCLV